MRSVISVIILLAVTISVAESGIVKGRVTSKTDNEPLPGVNVRVQGTNRGGVTDAEGRYLLRQLERGSHVLAFSIVGYQRESRTVEIGDESDEVEVSVVMTAIAIQTDPVIVSATRREQSFEESPVSISVMDAKGISYRNFVTIEDAMRYIPGVNMTEFQVNIRGSSGYSRGAGSRVLMLVDGIPLLTGDTGEINFESIPVGQVERIEVVKGASSALYGSSALGGVINVITKRIPSETETRLRTYGGFYTGPSFKSWEWSSGTRYLDGQSFSHSQRFGDFGLVVYGARVADDGFRQNDHRRRYNGYVKGEYNITPHSSFGITFNIMNQNRASFVYWKGLQNALVPADVQQGDHIQSRRFFLSAQFKETVSNQFFYTIKGLWFRNKFTSVVSGVQDVSRSHVFHGQGQASWTPNDAHILTFGFEGHHDRVRGTIFGLHTGGGAALYAQDEVKVGDQVQVTVGGRFDYQKLDSLEANNQLNPRLGVVYHPAGGTSIRGSAGRGFRSPTVAEAFVTSTADVYTIVPNPALKPERSVSFEIGANQVLGETAILDVALFQSSITNLIEADFNQSGEIQFQNVTKAKIQGLEFSAKLSPFGKTLFFDLGYTYIFPKDEESGDILFFRPRHLLYASSLFQFGIMRLGVDFRFVSKVERIQPLLSFVVPDASQRVPIYVTDLRLGADFTSLDFPLTATLNVNNLLQYNYLEMVGNVASQRSVVLVLEAVF